MESNFMKYCLLAGVALFVFVLGYLIGRSQRRPIVQEYSLGKSRRSRSRSHPARTGGSRPADLEAGSNQLLSAGRGDVSQDLVSLPDPALPCARDLSAMLHNTPRYCNLIDCTKAHAGSRSPTGFVQVIQCLGGARREICVCMNQITLTVIADALIKLAQRVNVIIITDAERNKNENDQVPRLIEHLGARVHQRGGQLVERGQKKTLMHNKYCIIDREIVMHGSSNWTTFAVLNNHETILIRRDKPLAEAFYKNFQQLLKSQ